MRLEHLFDSTMHYEPPPDRITPFPGHDAVSYGTGVGEVRGDRIEGAVRWSNWPRRRSDHV